MNRQPVSIKNHANKKYRSFGVISDKNHPSPTLESRSHNPVTLDKNIRGITNKRWIIPLSKISSPNKFSSYLFINNSFNNAKKYNLKTIDIDMNHYVENPVRHLTKLSLTAIHRIYIYNNNGKDQIHTSKIATF